MSDNPSLNTFGFCSKCGYHLNVCRGEHAPQPIEEGMTPELEAKARELNEWAKRLSAYWPMTSWNQTHEWEKTERVQQRLEFYRRELEQFAASQLSAERKWWIERIEQERDKWIHFSEGHFSLDDLLTSVRERG